jgi:hypothetical protein
MFRFKKITMKNQDKRPEEGIPEFLQGLKKQNPFITPHNYFKDLPDLIMQRIQKEAEQKITPSVFEVLWGFLRPFLTPKPAWALALVVIVAGISFLDLEKPENALSLEDDVSMEEISNYVQLHLDEFEEDDFYTTEVAEIDILGESLDLEQMDPMFDGLIDDIDLETIQRIL